MVGFTFSDGLLGIASEICEISIRPKDFTRKLMIILATGKEDPFPDVAHQLFRGQLKGSCGVFALDLSSAQYGYYDSVVPFGTYAAGRVSNFLPERTRVLGLAKAEEMRQVQCTLINGNRILRKEKSQDGLCQRSLNLRAPRAGRRRNAEARKG